MAEETAPDASLAEEHSGSDPLTPETTGTPSAFASEVPVKEYILTRREQKIAVYQYVSDTDVSETINSFLNFCRDMGWSVEVQ